MQPSRRLHSQSQDELDQGVLSPHIITCTRALHSCCCQGWQWLTAADHAVLQAGKDAGEDVLQLCPYYF